jgi:hypothetical protein
MSDTISFAKAAQRLRRPAGNSRVPTASIERIEQLLNQVTELQKEAKANIGDAILVLEENAKRLRRITPLLSQATVMSATFGAQLAEVEQLIKIARDEVGRL